MSTTRHTKLRRITLLLGTETCWPSAYEQMMRKLDLRVPMPNHDVTFEIDRCTIEPFNLRYKPRYHLVVDRLTHWFMIAREWLKKISLMDNVYLLNNPFTFQSMEKHSAFCAMIRCGLHIPDTWIIPQKEYEKSESFRITTERYNKAFDLDAIAGGMGYPIYMKPYDGGGWVGVTRVNNSDELHKAYDDSKTRVMHLQKAVIPFDVFCRAIAVGPQVLPMHYDPEQPLHKRYLLDHNFLSPKLGKEMVIITKLINSFFRWEYNSCEVLIRDGVIHPIDYANACPDSSLTSLHHYFPWVVKALIRWTTFCAATERKMQVELDMNKYWAVGDRNDLTYEQKLDEYEKMSDAYFETEKFNAFCAKNLPNLDEQMLEFTKTEEFMELLRETVRIKFPAHEHEEFIAHYAGLIHHWQQCEEDRLNALRKAVSPAPEERPAVKVAARGAKAAEKEAEAGVGGDGKGKK
ncbi:MAG: hypothetical protein HYY93_07185 [Planctomycetes bacterium]|nr:hypothetical protein [Planctomycetota bacterium]